MNIVKTISLMVGGLVVAILWSFILAAVGLWGLSYFAPEIFAFDWEHLLPLWCIMFALRSIFHNPVEVKVNKN